MKSSLVSLVLVVIVSILATACGATVKSGADWKSAYDEDRDTCDRQKSPSQEVYTACLEKLEYDRKVSQARASGMPVPTTSATQAVPPPPVPTTSATQAVPPPPVVQPVPPRVTIVSPESTGLVCGAPKSMILVVDNPNSDYLVEVRSPGLKPLDCEAGLYVQQPVVRRGGHVDFGQTGRGVLLIPPKTRVQLVALPFNGGLGNVRVELSLVLNSGAPNIPFPQVGDMVRIFAFPRGNNEPHYQDASMSWFNLYK